MLLLVVVAVYIRTCWVYTPVIRPLLHWAQIYTGATNVYPSERKFFDRVPVLVLSVFYFKCVLLKVLCNLLSIHLKYSTTSVCNATQNFEKHVKL